MIETVLFDWGDTLMRVFPGASGPMSEWPEVEAVEGAHAALQAFYLQYHLVVVTGAVDSNADQVRAALNRVGLDGFIEAVFTSHEVGLRKNDPGYYQGVLDKLKQSPEKALMVGDDYRSDILAASQAGIAGLWLNPGCKAAPDLPPVQVAETATLDGILPILEKSWLPTPDTCLEWLAEKDIPVNILSHSKMVANVAYLLAAWLRQVGIPVDPLLAHRGGLLHDLDKVAARQQGRVHGELAHEWILANGWPELAEIVCRHPLFAIQDPYQKPRTWEERLVFYADKIVERNQLVPVATRIKRLCERNPDQENEIRESQAAVSALEANLCRPLNCSPDELIGRLREAF